jgi:hypothetical protein
MPLFPGPSTDAPPTPKAKGARVGKGKKALSLNGAAPSAAPATVAEAGKVEDNGAEIAADSDGAAPTAGDVPLEHAPGRVESADVKARLQSMKVSDCMPYHPLLLWLCVVCGRPCFWERGEWVGVVGVRMHVCMCLCMHACQEAATGTCMRVCVLCVGAEGEDMSVRGGEHVCVFVSGRGHA